MTKQEFITALHHACPAFMKDRRSYAKLIGQKLEVEFRNKWPKWPHYLSSPPPILREPNHFDFDSVMEGLEIFNQAEAANVELDPILAYREVFRVIAEDTSEKLPEGLLEKEMGFKSSKDMVLE